VPLGAEPLTRRDRETLGIRDFAWPGRARPYLLPVLPLSKESLGIYTNRSGAEPPPGPARRRISL